MKTAESGFLKQKQELFVSQEEVERLQKQLRNALEMAEAQKIQNSRAGQQLMEQMLVKIELENRVDVVNGEVDRLNSLVKIKVEF